MSEENEFLKEMQSLGVKPLSKDHRIVPPKPPRKVSLPLRTSDKPVPQYVPLKRPKSARPRKINRKFEPDWTLDLHGFTADEAIDALERELVQAHRKGYSSMLVITGKGLNSSVKGGVLPKVVMDWLDVDSPQFVYSIEHAPIFLGGTGAILVFFEKN